MGEISHCDTNLLELFFSVILIFLNLLSNKIDLLGGSQLFGLAIANSFAAAHQLLVVQNVFLAIRIYQNAPMMFNFVIQLDHLGCDVQ